MPPRLARRTHRPLLMLVGALVVAGCARDPSPEAPPDTLSTSASTSTAAPRIALSAPTKPTDLGEAPATPSATPIANTPTSEPPTTTSLSTATSSPTGAVSPTTTVPAASAATASAPDPTRDVTLTASLAGVHFAGERADSAAIFGRAELEGWAVELAYVDGEESAADLAQRMIALHERGFRPILRIDYAPGQNIPSVRDPDALARTVTFAAEIVSRAEGALQHVIVGNEPNIDAEGNDPERLTECRAGRTDCAPTTYARVYRSVRAAIAPLGAAALVAGVSPGTADHPARWMGGPEYLAAVLAELPPGSVDGIALHAYGLEADPVPGLPADRLAYFQELVNRQLAAIDGAGHDATPLFLSEMNEYTDPDADFIRAAYRWLDTLNGARRGDIQAAVWFVWTGDGAWDAFALEGAPQDVRAAFAEVAQAYPPGR